MDAASVSGCLRIGGRLVATNRGFLKAVNKWTRETEQRSLDAFQEGSKDFYDALAEETPVDTGHLRGSLVATVNGATESSGPTNVYQGEGSGAAESYANIDAAKLGDRISYRYRATYWRRVNFGFVGMDSLGRSYNQAGRFWIQRVGAQYRSIMRAAATRLKLRMK